MTDSKPLITWTPSTPEAKRREPDEPVLGHVWGKVIETDHPTQPGREHTLSITTVVRRVRR